MTTLQPRLTPFAQAVEAYREARLRECGAALHGHTGREARVLLARVLLRNADACAALGVLGDIDDTQLYNTERGEILTLSGLALTIDRRSEEARQTLDLARVFVFGSGSAALETEFYYVEALWAMGAPDFDEMDRAAQRALSVPVYAFDRHDYFVPSPNSRARALHMRAIVSAGREDYASNARLMREALTTFATSSSPDLWVEASLLMNWSYLIRDVDLPDDADALRQRVVAADWPVELAHQQFEIYRSLGWSSALRGNDFGAFSDFRRAAELAPSPAHKILSSVNRAFLGRELGETHCAREELEYAATLAGRIDWNAAGEERVGLVMLAQEIAAYAPERARAMLERYRRIETKLSPLAVNNFDRRPRAHEAFAEASILKANHARHEAIEKLSQAFAICKKTDYHWLAAVAALELASLGAGDMYAAYGMQEARRRPNSWLARRAENRA